MKDFLKSGLPHSSDYKRIIIDNEYKIIESYSNNFLLQNDKYLEYYKTKWVKDPLHNCFRQYEYPYVYNNICRNFHFDQPLKILDAGSGITFFPYHINSLYKQSEIFCVDRDDNLKSIYDNINLNNQQNINFINSDIQKLPFDNNYFDIIYCISVLEHTNNYDIILKEFNRILKDDGILILTFDVSIDGKSDISIDGANNLLIEISKLFDYEENKPISISDIGDEIFTTLDAKNININLLPWKEPSLIEKIIYFLKNKQLLSWPQLMTFYTLTARKKIF